MPLLQSDVHLNAVTLLEERQSRHPDQWETRVLRTLPRRMGLWRSQFGAEREVYFAHEHSLARQGISNFTVADALNVEIGGVLFKPRLYQFTLAHSGWRHDTVVDSGERFLALSTGSQAALWALGGSPEEHRTDSLSASFNNLAEQEALIQRYSDLCLHYGLRPTRCNPGQSNENGFIEARNNSLKKALDQALRLRGTRSFEMRADYEAFVDKRRATHE